MLNQHGKNNMEEIPGINMISRTIKVKGTTYTVKSTSLTGLETAIKELKKSLRRKTTKKPKEI